MAPPLSTPGETSAQSIYTFPFPSAATNEASSSIANRSSNDAKSVTTKSTPITGAAATGAENNNPRPNYVCSEITQTTALFLLHRRLLLPTFVIPVTLLCIPPIFVSALAFLAYHVTGTGGSATSLLAIILTSTVIIASTLLLVQTGKILISNHFSSDEKAKRNFMAQSAVALPFWSLVLSLVGVRILYFIYGGVFRPLFTETLVSPTTESLSRGWLSWILGLMGTTSFWTIKTCSVTFLPSLAWAWLSLLVAIRYTGPFSPILRCSSTPLKINPFDAALTKIGRNFTSKNRFLDMIANVLDKLSAATSPDTKKGTTTTGAAAPKAGEASGVTLRHSNDGQKPLKLSNTFVKATTTNNGSILGKNGGMIELIKLSSATNARYSRPGLITIVIQVIANIIGGHIFGHTFVLHFLGSVLNRLDETVVAVTVTTCLLVPFLELFSIINETELHYGHYSSAGTILSGGKDGILFSHRFVTEFGSDVVQRVQRSLFGYAMITPIISTLIISLWAHFGQYLLKGGSFSLVSPSYAAIIQSLLISYTIVAFTVMALAIQDVLTRWAVCAPGVDADVLLFQTSTSRREVTKATTTAKTGVTTSTNPERKKKFLTEDLLIQSVLMGDGNTVTLVIANPDTEKTQTKMTMFKSHQDEEIGRNDKAVASFARWIQSSSTTASGRLSDDMLRMSLLESLGGGGNCCLSASQTKTSSRYFGEARHLSAVRKRLDLSAATASPGRQPIAAPVIRALCSFSGGLGDAIYEIYRQEIKDGKPIRKSTAETWKLPPGSLAAAELSIVAAARFVVMNSSIDKRSERICLLLPCVLQSAYKLRRGLFTYAKATSTMCEVKFSSFDKTGGTDCLLQYIEKECPELCPVLSACNNSARMVIQTDRALEEVVLRRSWEGDMQRWLVGLNCDES